MYQKASMTVEAALICPFVCLILCGMIVVTLQFYQQVDEYATGLINMDRQGVPATDLIRLEAVTEDLF